VLDARVEGQVKNICLVHYDNVCSCSHSGGRQGRNAALYKRGFSASIGVSLSSLACGSGTMGGQQVWRVGKMGGQGSEYTREWSCFISSYYLPVTCNGIPDHVRLRYTAGAAAAGCGKLLR
jgi:hypothetical protein